MSKEKRKDILMFNSSQVVQIVSIFINNNILQQCSLNTRQVELFKMRFIDCMPLEDIAEKFDITRERTRQIFEQSIRRLRIELPQVFDRLKELDNLKEEIKLSRKRTVYIEKQYKDLVAGIEKLKPHKLSDENPYLYRAIEDIELSVRAYNCLKAAGINIVADIMRHKQGDFLRFRNMGKRSLMEITDRLKENGLEISQEP